MTEISGLEKYGKRLRKPADAVAGIGRGQRVFIGSGCAEPQQLVAALAARGPQLADNQIVHLMTLGIAPYVDPKLTEGFRHNAFFIGPNVRSAIAQGRADYTPIFLSELPAMFRHGRLPIDVALIQVGPPDAHGFCSFGVAVDVVKAAAESARVVVAEINPNMPRTLGDSFIHLDRINMIVPSSEPILETRFEAPDEVARRIGEHVAAMVEDGSTMQLGIGTIPDSVLKGLTDKRDLGIHSEMFSDGVIDLVEKGVINGSRKTIHRGKIVASFVMGTRRLYDFIDDNPLIEMHPTEYVNDPFRICRHDRMVAINSALQVDLTGQVCADSLGTYFYSGIGGQVDFMRGAARSEGGKPIIALPSTADNGKVSRIVPTLTPGAGVVTSRGDVHYVVTEWGSADLHGKTIRQRAIALVHIAHPKFREELMKQARERHFVDETQVAMLEFGAEELAEFESDFALSDGTTIHFRPICPMDEEMMREMFYSLSPETVLHRFFHYVRAMPHEKLQDFLRVDCRNQMALVGVVQQDEHAMIVAVGRYALDTATRAAEVAFVVRDEWQCKGIGSYLFQRLLEVARARGISKFTAEVLAGNARMLSIFHRFAAAPLQSELRDGVYHLSFEIRG